LNIDELTIGQAKELASLLGSKAEGWHPFELGKSYLIRTVTHIALGRVKAVGNQELVLEDASWIADTDRFHDALKSGVDTLSKSEIEPFVNDVIVGRGSIIDATEYTHELPRKQK
jgi:hypothetical protein